MSKLADAYVEISARLDRLQSGLDSAHEMTRAGVGRTSGMMMGLWSAVVQQAIQMFQRMASGIADGIQQAVIKAGDLAESVSKVGATFGDSAGTIIEAADAMAAKFGTNKQVFIDGAANIGLIGKGAGMAKDEAAKFGVQFAKLADDIASFDNVSVEDAMVALRAGLVGETEPLRRFGVTITEAATQQEAFRLGLGRTKAELDSTDKITARASLIMKGFTDRIGDHERTQSSMNNQIREAQGRWENFRAELGEKLIPIMGEVSAGFSGLVKSLQDDFHTTGSALNEMGDVWKTVFTDIGTILRGSGVTTESWKDKVIAAFREVGMTVEEVTGVIRAGEMVANAAAGRKSAKGGGPGLLDVVSPLGADPIRAARAAMRDITQGAREFDRNAQLNRAIEAQWRRNEELARQAARPFVGPPRPMGMDLAQQLDAAEHAATEEARRAANAKVNDRDKRIWRGIFGGIPGIEAGISHAVGVEKAKLPFEFNSMATGQGMPPGLRNLMGVAGVGNLADFVPGAIRAGVGIEKGMKMREAFQSSMMNTSDIAGEVTKAALSHKDDKGERTAKATESIDKKMTKFIEKVDSQGRVTYARFAPKGAKA